VQDDERWRDLAGEPAIRGVDLLLAVGAGAARRARASVMEPLAATATGLLQLGARILTDDSRHPRVADLTARGEEIRAELERSAADRLRGLLRWAVEGALTALDLTELVLVHVDLDELASGIDVDAVVARTDLDAALDRMDLDAIAARVDLDAVLSRIDLDAVLSRVDLDAIVSRVDLDAILEHVDLNEVASRVDLDAILSHVDVDAILSRVDLNEIASRVDLDAIVQRVEPDAVVARVDMEAVVSRLDLAAIAREVLDAIDLPEIMRQSSGAVSSQAARVVRTEGMNADESVARFVDRVLRRSHQRGAVAP